MTDEQTKVDATAATTVTEVPEPELKIQNPHLTVRVNVPSLKEYAKTGLRGPIMKTARAWIRQRGLTVQLPGVVISETPNGGDEIDVEGTKVKADLKVITFSEKCILDNNVTINVPKKRQPKPKKEGKDGKAPKPTKAEAKAPKPAPKVEKEGAPSDW